MLMNCVSESVHIGALGLPGNLDLPPHPIGMVVVVPSEPGSRFNPRQQYLARQLHVEHDRYTSCSNRAQP